MADMNIPDSEFFVRETKVEGYNNEFTEVAVAIVLTSNPLSAPTRVEGKGQSRRPLSALAYALEDLAQKVKEKAQ